MTTKDYELLAGTLKFCKPSKIAKPKGFTHRLEKWEEIILELANALKTENPRFNKGKFLTACEFSE